jgi:hypothetical protein
MPSIAPSVPMSQVGRVLSDVGLAGLLGGNLFGRLALHPSVTEISDPSERGRVVNAAWRRYGTVNSLGVLAVTAGWVGARADEAADRRLAPDERAMARAKDVLVGVLAASGVALGLQGMAFARKAPGGAVPLEDGDTAAPSAPPDAQRLKRRLNALSTVSLAAEVGIVALNAAIDQRAFRRPPVRRLIPGFGRV